MASKIVIKKSQFRNNRKVVSVSTQNKINERLLLTYENAKKLTNEQLLEVTKTRLFPDYKDKNGKIWLTANMSSTDLLGIYRELEFRRKQPKIKKEESGE